MSRNTSEKLAQEYKLWISKEFVDQFGGSYVTAEEVGDKWRTDFEYTFDRHRFLINKTKYYLRTLWSGDQNNTNLQFLDAFVNKIAKFLSVYTVRAFESRKNRIYFLKSNDSFATLLLKVMDELTKSITNKSEKTISIEYITQAKKLLHDELFTNNSFISHIIEENSHRRNKHKYRFNKKQTKKTTNTSVTPGRILIINCIQNTH